jgi:MFS family permease
MGHDTPERDSALRRRTALRQFAIIVGLGFAGVTILSTAGASAFAHWMSVRNPNGAWQWVASVVGATWGVGALVALWVGTRVTTDVLERRLDRWRRVFDGSIVMSIVALAILVAIGHLIAAFAAAYGYPLGSWFQMVPFLAFIAWQIARNIRERGGLAGTRYMMGIAWLIVVVPFVMSAATVNGGLVRGATAMALLLAMWLASGESLAVALRTLFLFSLAFGVLFAVTIASIAIPAQFVSTSQISSEVGFALTAMLLGTLVVAIVVVPPPTILYLLHSPLFRGDYETALSRASILPGPLAGISAYIQAMSGDVEGSEATFVRHFGNDWHQMRSQLQTWAGWIRLGQGDAAAAGWHFHESYRQLGDIRDAPIEGLVIAHLLCAKDLDQALSLLDEKLAQSTQLAPMRMIGADPLATIVALRAWVLAATDQPDLARKEATDAEGRINSDLVHHAAQAHWRLCMAYDQLNDGDSAADHARLGAADTGLFGRYCREFLLERSSPPTPGHGA